MDLNIDAFIPASYIQNEYQKLDIYKRIAAIANREEMDDMTEELIDRFGDIPKKVQQLLHIAALKSQAHAAVCNCCGAERQCFKFTIYEKAKLDPFYARYTQAQYETYFASYLGGDDMWSRNASDGKTYEESIKETLLDDLKNMALLEEHMEDYDVKLTKADKKAINDAAKEFDKANSQKKKDKVSGSKENVKRVMTLMAIEQKMRGHIVADANVKVTDEEATQKHMQYVEFHYSTTSDIFKLIRYYSIRSGKEKNQRDGRGICQRCKDSRIFCPTEMEQGTEAKDATFDSD